MAQLLYSAKTADGRDRQGFVEADSARAARDQLRAQGLRQVVLHQEVAISQDEASLQGLSAADKAELAKLHLHFRERPGLLPLLQVVARKNRVWLVVDALLLAGGIWARSPALMLIAVALLALPFAPALWRYRHADRYQQLLKAHALGRWPEMVGLAGRLRSAIDLAENLDFDLDVRIASVRARQGDLPGALEDLADWQPRLVIHPGLYETRLAAVYAAGGDRAGFVQAMGQAQALSGDEPARVLDHALAQARFGDLARAEALMAGLDLSLLPPMAEGFVAWTQGLIAMRRGRPGALALLSRAVAVFLQRGGSPAVWTALAFCSCDQAMALHAAGQKAQAKATLKNVMPVLRAHADAPLLAVLRRDFMASESGR